ncbi:hypothetical protein [Actinophytocola glycyrrhizae]|uniref:Uncharacterized protein n=1 Tax=Actinophytocola glycyrrhizae TaxID=2044873 RepID=A0ABV9RWA5_9PSEU
MTRPELSPSVQVPVVVGTAGARGARLVKRLLTAGYGTAAVGGFAAVLMPWGMTWPWLAALCSTVLVAAFIAGLRDDLRSVGVVRLAVAPARGLYLRGPWATRLHDASEVVAVQVWCDCGGGARRSVAPHRDGMEVLLSGGRSVRIESSTAFAADVAVTLGELLAQDGIKVVDWGEVGALDS